MRLLYRCCAGIDVHKKSVSVCIRKRIRGKREPEIEGAVFGAFTQDLERLREWLRQHRVKHVAMESTRPITPVPTTLAVPPELCSKCSGWRLPKCIHVSRIWLRS